MATCMGSDGSAMKAMFWSSWVLGLSEAVQDGWTVAAATVTPEGLEVPKTSSAIWTTLSKVSLLNFKCAMAWRTLTGKFFFQMPSTIESQQQPSSSCRQMSSAMALASSDGVPVNVLPSALSTPAAQSGSGAAGGSGAN